MFTQCELAKLIFVVFLMLRKSYFLFIGLKIEQFIPRFKHLAYHISRLMRLAYHKQQMFHQASRLKICSESKSFIIATWTFRDPFRKQFWAHREHSFCFAFPIFQPVSIFTCHGSWVFMAWTQFWTDMITFLPKQPIFYNIWIMSAHESFVKCIPGWNITLD